VKSLSRVRLFETPWTAAHQAHPPMGFSRQEYWSGEGGRGVVSGWGDTCTSMADSCKCMVWQKPP